MTLEQATCIALLCSAAASDIERGQETKIKVRRLTGTFEYVSVQRAYLMVQSGDFRGTAKSNAKKVRSLEEVKLKNPWRDCHATRSRACIMPSIEWVQSCSR